MSDFTTVNTTDQLLEVITQIRDSLIVSLKGAGRYATGQTEQQLTIEVHGQNSAQLLAPWWFYALQDGRKPTKPGAPAGNPTLLGAIQMWCQAKGIDERAAYAITQSIHKNGYPGKPGIIDTPLSKDNIDSILNGVMGDIANIYTVATSAQIDEALQLT